MADSTTHEAACSEMGALAEAHKNFEVLVGTFKAEVKMWMGPGEPMVSTGVMVNTLELGGRFLHQEYKGDDAGGPFPNFEGRGYFGFNTTTEQYEGFWIDSACTLMQHETGTLDASGKTWNMAGTMTDPQTKKPMKKRSVTTVQDQDRHSMEMFFTSADGPEAKAMEINYTRVK